MKKYANLFLASTDTVVGIGGKYSEENRLLINEAKHSPLDKKIIIIVSSIDMAKKYFGSKGFNTKAELLAKKYWPGQVTLALNDEIALRIPDKQGLLELVEEIGPIYLTSANISGEAPLEMSEAKKTFPDLGAYYDFGPGNRVPSTIIDVETERVIRK